MRADRYVGARRHVREQFETLKHHAHTLAHLSNVSVLAMHVDSIEDNRAAVDHVESVDGAQQRRLAGPARPDQADDLATVDIEGYAVQRLHRAIALGDVDQFDNRSCRYTRHSLTLNLRCTQSASFACG